MSVVQGQVVIDGRRRRCCSSNWSNMAKQQEQLVKVTHISTLNFVVPEVIGTVGGYLCVSLILEVSMFICLNTF